MDKNQGAIAVVFGLLTAIIPTYILFQCLCTLFFIPFVVGSVCFLMGVIALRTDRKFSEYVGWIALLLMLVAVIVPFWMFFSSQASGDPIVLEIPNGYRGPLQLIIDKERGVDVPLTDGRYTYRFPASGKLVIKDDSPFRNWHSETRVYANGNPIPTAAGNDLPPDTVSFHELGSGHSDREGESKEYFRYFLGTKAEMQTYVDSIRAVDAGDS